MAGSSARRKGANGEREVFGLLNAKLLGTPFERNLLQARSGGADNEGDHPVAIEVKRQERVSLLPWLKQVRAAAMAGSVQVPVLAWRRNAEPWSFLVDMTLDQFVDYLEKIHGYQTDPGTAEAVRHDPKK